MDISEHEKWFADHVDAKISSCSDDSKPLRIKRDHTARVLANAAKISAEERFPETLHRSVLLAALYHDLSRFDQYLVYGTFKDKDSRNHGSWSLKLLRSHRRLEQEQPEIRSLVSLAVALHNRRYLPSGLSADEALVCNAVRDADKLDIVRVMHAHLSIAPYNPTVVLGLPDSDLAGPRVREDAYAGRSASYSDLQSVNDFRLLLGTWFFGLNFRSSKRIFIDEGHGAALVSDLPQNDTYGEIRARLLNLFRAGC